MKPIMGMKMMKVVLSQLMCLWMLDHVMGVSAMCTLVASHLPLLRSGL